MITAEFRLSTGDARTEIRGGKNSVNVITWALSNPIQYMLAGWGIAFMVVICLLFVGGNPAQLLMGGRWSVIGLIAWTFIWPIMIVILILMTVMVAATDDP